MALPNIQDSPDRHFVHRALNPDQIQAYNEQGYLIYGRALTDEGLRLMREECMRAWVEEKGDFDPSKTWLQNALLVNIHHRSPLVRSYYFEGPLVSVAEQLIGPNVKAATSQLTFKMRGNTQAFGWHQDNGYGELEPYDAISCLTLLDDADRGNGCLWILPGSHRRGQIDVGARGSPGAKREQQEIALDVHEGEAIPMEMKAGEALLFHCWTLHKSEGNHSASRDRRILFFRYADADAVEVYNDRTPRLGRLLRGHTSYPEVERFESDLG